MIYVGLKTGWKREVFHADSEPTSQTHGHRFGAVIGEFKTIQGAKFMAFYGQANPHCQDVDQAEQLAADNPDLDGLQ